MSKRFRGVILAIALVAGFSYLYPTLKWYFLFDEGKKSEINSTIEDVRQKNNLRSTESLTTLIDLIREDATAPLPKEFSFLKLPTKSRLEASGKKANSPMQIADVFGVFSRGALSAELENHYAVEAINDRRILNQVIRLGLDIYGGISVILEAVPESLVDRLGREPTPDEIEIAMNGVNDALTGRIDTFGVSEPQIRRLGDRQILLELPGEADQEQVKRYISGAGGLAFYLENTEATETLDSLFHSMTGTVAFHGRDEGRIVEHETIELNREGRPVDPQIDSVLPAGLIVRGFYIKDSYGIDRLRSYVVLEPDPILDGTHINDVGIFSDSFSGTPRVNFQLDQEGGTLLYNATQGAVGRTMVTVVGDRVRSGAVIQEALSTNVSVSGLDQKEASDLSLLLQTASLPIDFEIVSQDFVGPALGGQTIRYGLFAVLGGLIAVLLFMVIWYKGSGLIAGVVLLLNFFLILCLLSVMNFTLTLTSIASLILTVGMAVDANVIIFERIKEELALGKTRAIAVDIGFRRAFSTILDANVTTFIAAVFLSILGKGAIQGFAVVLSIGIASTLFCALFVARLLFDVGTETLHHKKISISWSLEKKSQKKS